MPESSPTPPPREPAAPHESRTRAAAAAALAAFGASLLALHASVLRYPFIADDYIFLHEVRGGRLESLLAGFNIVQNYYRPLGRELYFFGLSRAFGSDPLLFHLFNLGVLLATIALVAALGRRLAGPRAGVLAAGAYALLHPHRVQLGWVSCSQDLLATALGVGAALLLMGGRRRLAAAAFLLALFAKESVAPLPLVLALAEAWRAPERGLRARLAAGWRATSTLWIAAALWAGAVLGVRLWKQAWVTMDRALPVADVAVELGSLWEGFRLALLTYVYLDQPLLYLRQAAERIEWPWLAMALAALGGALAALTPARRAPGGPRAAGPRDASGHAWRLGLVWATVGALPVALVGHHFSSYYVSFSAVGFALAAGWLLARAPRPVAAAVLVLCAAAAAVANGVESFRITQEQRERPGVSYVSISRLAWEVRYLDALQAALAQDPPPRGAIVYLSFTPPYLGLATAGDRALQVWFDDPTLAVSFITQYRPGDTARPKRFVRFDADRWTFALLPDSLVDAIVAGEEALAAGRPALARAGLERALGAALPGVHDIERAELWNSLGVACHQLGDTAAARRAWLAALAVDPDSRGALLNLAAWSAGRGHFPQARQLVLRLLAATPNDPVGLLYLARLERALGDEAGAARAWDALAAAHPGFADSVLRAGGSP